MESIEIIINNEYGSGRVEVSTTDSHDLRPIQLDVERGVDSSGDHTSFYTAREARMVADALIRAADDVDPQL